MFYSLYIICLKIGDVYMTKKIPAEKNIAKTPKKTTNSEENADTNIKTSIADIPALSYSEFMNSIAEKFFSITEKDENVVWVANNMYETFGPEYSMEDFAKDFPKDKNTVDLIYKYKDLLIRNINEKSFSINADELNSGMSDFTKISNIEMDINSTTLENCYAVLNARTKNIPELQNSIDVYKIGRGIYDNLNSNTIISDIEIEDTVQKLNNFYNNDKIEAESLARAYHNIAMLFEKRARQNVNPLAYGTSMKHSYEYMRKSLALTCNINLIKTSYEYLPDNMDNKTALTMEACDRAIKKDYLDNEKMYQIHKMYGKLLTKSNVSDIFSSRRNKNMEEAIYHYKQAYEYTDSEEKKANTLRSISKLQKSYDKKEYLKTRTELATRYLSGKTKVRELISLSEEVKISEYKTFFLEGAVNEIVASAEIKNDEKSLLLKNVLTQLRPQYNEKEDASKLKVLDKMEKKFCQPKTEEKIVFTRISSNGKDIFSK